MNQKSNLWLPIVLMVVFAITRWPGLLPQNFSAAYALAFCCGVFLPARLAWWLPLTTMLLTNILLNLFYYHAPLLDGYMLITTAVFVPLVLLGRCFKADSAWWKLVGGGLIGAILFYVVTNTVAWLYESTQPYAKTLSGWFQALTIGTSGWPETWKFFRNTLLSGGLFTALFVAAMRAGSVAESPAEKDPLPAPEPEADDSAKAPQPDNAAS